MQPLNILKGDMSFVGPKALRPFEIDSNDTALKQSGFLKGPPKDARSGQA